MISPSALADHVHVAHRRVQKVELLNLEGCTDPEALTYKPYFVKADSAACYYGARPAPKP